MFATDQMAADDEGRRIVKPPSIPSVQSIQLCFSAFWFAVLERVYGEVETGDMSSYSARLWHANVSGWTGRNNCFIILCKQGLKMKL